MFPSNAAYLADIPGAPVRIPLGWPANAVIRGYICCLGQEDHLLNSKILYNWLSKHVSSHHIKMFCQVNHTCALYCRSFNGFFC